VRVFLVDGPKKYIILGVPPLAQGLKPPDKEPKRPGCAGDKFLKKCKRRWAKKSPCCNRLNNSKHRLIKVFLGVQELLMPFEK